MDLQKISLEPIRRHTVAILGYGNQGRTQALNLRDSGVQVVVGARPGPGAEKAAADGFTVHSLRDAAALGDIVMLLLADRAIPPVHAEVVEILRARRSLVGLSHGYVLTFAGIAPVQECQYFVAAPKGPGAILRKRFENGGGLPGAYAFWRDAEVTNETEALVQSYCKAIGIASSHLLRCRVDEETEGDLFGEQAVLCGGMIQLIEAAFETLVENGHSPETAFFDVCYEASVLLQLWIENGPERFAEKISPTAFYGGFTRGRRLVDPPLRAELQNIFSEVREGKFAAELKAEGDNGYPLSRFERERIKNSLVAKTFRSLKQNPV